jgi:hypothetical protein
MKTSEQIELVVGAVFEVQGRLKPVQRSKEVKAGKYSFKYAPLDSIAEYIVPILQAHGLMFMQAVNADVLTTRIFHRSGQWIESETHLNRDHANMQGFGGEVTYKRRYALSALLGIVSDDDNDVPHITARGALTDAMEGLSTRKQNMVVDLAETIKDKFNQGLEVGAYEEYLGLKDNEEIMALWGLLPSNIRSSIKKLAEADKQKG